MQIIKQVNLETLNQEEKEAIELGTETEESLLAKHEETLEVQETEREEKLKKSEEIGVNQRIRAEKAEDEVKTLKGVKDVIPSKIDNALSQSDLIAILKADVAEEDISVVSDYAKIKGISVSEALKSSVVKTILSEKNEERKTADTTSTGNQRRGSVRQTPSQLLENAKKGTMPESDEDLDELIKARKTAK